MSTYHNISILLRIQLGSYLRSPASKLSERKNLKTWQRSLGPVKERSQSSENKHMANKIFRGIENMHCQSQELLDYSIKVKEMYFNPTKIVLLS
jgi:hypothetical protein